MKDFNFEVLINKLKQLSLEIKKYKRYTRKTKIFKKIYNKMKREEVNLICISAK